MKNLQYQPNNTLRVVAKLYVGSGGSYKINFDKFPFLNAPFPIECHIAGQNGQCRDWHSFDSQRVGLSVAGSEIRDGYK